MIDEIKIGSLVITSRSRYGTVINIKMNTELIKY